MTLFISSSGPLRLSVLLFIQKNFFFSLQGLDVSSPHLPVKPRVRPASHQSERTDSYRFSMANLEETHEAELDAILGELSLLEKRQGDLRTHHRCHSRSNSIVSGVTNTTISSESSGCVSGQESVNGSSREPRTDSPDNDSAFSDTVSLLSSESSASSGVSAAHKNLLNNANNNNNQQQSVSFMFRVYMCAASNQFPSLAGQHKSSQNPISLTKTRTSICATTICEGI